MILSEQYFFPPRHKGSKMLKAFVSLCVFASLLLNLKAQVRTDISLNKGWKSVADDNNKSANNGFEKASFSDAKWKHVEVPHNWDDYYGYRRKLHGNRHGYAWYRKTFIAKPQGAGKRYFLFFEGVGSYATVWLNGKQVGYHAGGRTTFTIDVTNSIVYNKPNLLAVRADHPANIKDLPWVCGGCSDERGFSEGSQPMGIFRPIHLIITNAVKVEPFGVHIWNDTTISTKSAQLHVETEIKNYSNQLRNITVVNRLTDKQGKVIVQTSVSKQIAASNTSVIAQQPAAINNPHLWSLEDPYLYTLSTEIVESGKVIDKITTPYGIRWISWPIGKAKSSNQFYLNGKPVFINGIAEYEHLIGSSHAFTAEQIHTRVMEVKAAGFNAFRDAHQPHNLRYQNYWDSLGLLWWPQLSAHIWYDTPEFRKNFKQLLTDWVKERRNSPSIILWGLQNESKLPEDFAKECTELIRKLDPTSSSQRLVTTCNGGTGADWDVPQNWTGTYGGNPATYGEDVKRQILEGEYGAWRTLDLHTEGGFVQNGPLSEDRMTQLMEMKVRLAESVKDSSAGQFMWLLTSHDNPGRVQGGEGYRELDRVGPVNYKGLLTPWEEPTDVFYMFRSNYAPKDKEPMVYIVSHTWPNRWTTTGKKDSIIVYSNCDEVELFNDVRSQSLGRRKRGSVGTHFQWDGVNIDYNVLYAVGYVNGKEVAHDYIVLNHLPKAPHFNEFIKAAKNITAPAKGYNYVYRVNCGGAGYVDENGNKWLVDRARTNGKEWGSTSWTKDFEGMPPYFASERRIFDPIQGTKDWKLFQTFRYGRDKLRYDFPVSDGEYLVELYFTEPWFGVGGGIDCKGWRLFDVAINNKTVLKDVDIWSEVGHHAALKKTVKATVTGGVLTISFPRVASGQAVISAIAIASLNKNIKPAPSPEPLFKIVNASSNYNIRDWVDLGDEVFVDDKTTFSALPPELFGAQWLKTSKGSVANKQGTQQLQLLQDADIQIAIDTTIKSQLAPLKDFTNTKTLVETDAGKAYNVFKKRLKKGEIVTIDNEAGSSAIIMATPASSIEPAYDLKPVTSYKAINAAIKGPAIEKGQVDGKDCVIFKKASADNVLEWTMLVGVADIYSLTISYNNPKANIIKGKLEFFAADGTKMKEEDVEFTPTKPGKTNYISTTTGSMINAGTYKVRLTSEDAEGVNINSLDVQ
jgi:beta-galactosidase